MINQRPTMPEVSLTPTPADTSDDLLATIDLESIDPEGDAVSYSFQWQVDGSASGLDHRPPPELRDAERSRVTISVTPSDGETGGTERDGESDHPEYAPRDRKRHHQSCRATEHSRPHRSATGVIDVDGDDVSLTYSWTVDGIAMPASGDTLPAPMHSPGSFIGCTVTPADDETDGEPATASPVRINLLPVIHAVLVTPAMPTVDDTLACETGLLSDGDGDPVSPTYHWVINGIDVGASTASLDSSWFARGDEVSCRVTPSDGREDGASLTSDSVTIQNALPEITSLEITPDVARTDTVLTASATGADADLDVLSFTFVWTIVNGTPVEVTGDTLDGSLYFEKGDEVGLSVVASDGFDTASSELAESILVENSAPSTPLVSINPLAPAAGVDSLVCTIDDPGTDPDLDPLTHTIVWDWDGEVFGATTDTHTEGDTIPGHVTWAEEEWSCVVTSSDGTEEGDPGYATVIPEWRFSGWGDDPFLS